LINVSAIVLGNRVIDVPPFRSNDAGDDSAEGNRCAGFFVRRRLAREQHGMSKDVNGGALPCSRFRSDALALSNRTKLVKFCVTITILIIHAFLTNFVSPTTSTFMIQQHLLIIKSINT
jgi:hypothetical protein